MAATAVTEDTEAMAVTEVTAATDIARSAMADSATDSVTGSATGSVALATTDFSNF